MTEGTNTLLYYFRKDAMPLALNLSYMTIGMIWCAQHYKALL